MKSKVKKEDFADVLFELLQKINISKNPIRVTKEYKDAMKIMELYLKDGKCN